MEGKKHAFVFSPLITTGVLIFLRQHKISTECLEKI